MAGGICLETLKSDLFIFLTRFIGPNEVLKIWNFGNSFLLLYFLELHADLGGNHA